LTHVAAVRALPRGLHSWDDPTFSVIKGQFTRSGDTYDWNFTRSGD
jgi:hypothetical protein